MKAAIYARYSTDKQSEASIVDQVRVCERLAERHGFQVVARFQDAAISGGTTRRPGYQAMLAAARRHEFDVIAAEDTSRLWRNLAEQAPRMAELADLGIEVVTHDLDSRTESAGMLSAVLGASSEAYRREIGRRTRRGLEGRARKGASAGGRAYGYVPGAISGTGKIEIDESQAAVVREIFAKYAEGYSAREIAIELNRRRVPSPGSTWKRVTRRKEGWLSSTICGGPKRGAGILNNETYRGRLIWNRVRWARSASDGQKRRAIPNPPTEWIIVDDLRLRIVPEALWERVKARQAVIERERGARIRAGLKGYKPGSGPKFLLSGLLKCGDCDASFVIADRRHYACSSRLHGRACKNDARIPRSIVESGILAGVKDQLLAPDVIAEARRRVQRVLKAHKAPTVDRGRIAKLQREVQSLVDAIAAGALAASPAIAARLTATESELARLQSQASTPAPKVAELLPRFEARWRALVANFEAALVDQEIPRARAGLREITGDIQVVTTAQEIRLETQKGAVDGAFLRAAGGQQTFVVAGAGFEPATFGL